MSAQAAQAQAPAGDQPGVTYEGKPVQGVRMRFSGMAAPVDCDDRVIQVDDIVRVAIEARVTGVAHVVDPKTGELLRVQTVKPIDMEFIPWNPNDPTDSGVIRAAQQVRGIPYSGTAP